MSFEVDPVWVLAVKANAEGPGTYATTEQIISLCDSWFEKERALAAARAELDEARLRGLVPTPTERAIQDGRWREEKARWEHMERENAQLRAEAERLNGRYEHWFKEATKARGTLQRMREWAASGGCDRGAEQELLAILGPPESGTAEGTEEHGA